MVLDVAARYDAGTDTRSARRAAKFFCSEMVGRVADRAVQVHGGAGLHARRRRSSASTATPGCSGIYEGTSQIQQVIIAGAAARGGARLSDTR